MSAIIKGIQVGGSVCANSLEEACREYIKMVSRSSEMGYRPKLNFTIKLADGTIKSITIRDEDDQTIAYGDFEGLQSFLDYSKEVLKK